MSAAAYPEERSTCDESYDSNDSVASVEHNQPKPFCCGYMPDVPSLFVHTQLMDISHFISFLKNRG